MAAERQAYRELSEGRMQAALEKMKTSASTQLASTASFILSRSNNVHLDLHPRIPSTNETECPVRCGIPQQGGRLFASSTLQPSRQRHWPAAQHPSL